MLWGAPDEMEWAQQHFGGNGNMHDGTPAGGCGLMGQLGAYGIDNSAFSFVH